MALITHLFSAGKGERRGERGASARDGRSAADEWEDPVERKGKEVLGERERRGEMNEKDFYQTGKQKDFMEIWRTKRFQLLVFVHSLRKTSKILIIVNGSIQSTYTGAVCHSFMVFYMSVFSSSM